MNNALSKIAWVFIFIMILISCHKEIDEIDPVIEIIAPAENEIYAVFDTMHIKANVSDNNRLENIGIALVNADYIPVLPTQSVKPSQPVANLEVSMPIDNKNLPGGMYSIVITAFDGYNTKSQFRSVWINELPTEVTGLIILTKSGIGQTSLNVYDSSFNVIKVMPIASDNHLSDVNSKWEQLYMVTEFPSTLSALRLKDFVEEWNSLAAPPYAEYTGIITDDLVFISSKNGDIWGYDPDGTVKFQTNIIKDRFPENIFVTGQYVLADVITVSGSYRYLNCWYRKTGALKSSLMINDDIIEFQGTENQILVFSNSIGEGMISTYDPENNIITIMNSLPGQSIIDAENIDDQNFLISVGTGIYKYNIYYNSLLLYKPGTINRMIYEPVRRELILFRGFDLQICDYTSGEVVHELNLADPILNVHVIYNK